MDDVFHCDCGVRTREPFILRGVKMCAVCAERINPAVVISREHYWQDQRRRKDPNIWRHKVWR